MIRIRLSVFVMRERIKKRAESIWSMSWISPKLVIFSLENSAFGDFSVAYMKAGSFGARKVAF